jgi:hypothetical protein
MKKITDRPTLAKFAVSVLYAAAVMNTHAQTWQTILDLGPRTDGKDVLVNPTNSPLPPGVFVAADMSGPDNELAFFDTSQTQSPSNPSVVVISPGLINRLGCDSSLGALYSVGYVRKADNSLAWDVRRSLDGGQSWAPLDSGWQLSPGASTRAMGFAADQAGNLFVCGNATDSKGRGSLILRKSGDQGMTWQTQAIGVAVALYFLPANSQNQGGLFAVGRLGANAWGVQGSRDAGNTWTTVDSWMVSKSGDTVAMAIASDPQGNLYVAGHGKKGTTSPYGWYVRRSSDGGNTWQMLLTDFSTGGDSLVNDVAVDGAGNLWVVGAVNGADSTTEIWAMQRWNQVSGWSGPMYPYGNLAPRSHARGATADPTGRVYVTGWVFDPNGYSHATVLEVNN